MMKSEIFLDASYGIALSIESDEHHESAKRLAIQLKKDRTRLITTRPVVFELGNSLSSRRLRHIGVRLVEALSKDLNVEIVTVSTDLYEKAIGLFKSRTDKDWGLTDCFSFVVMQERGLTASLTADIHFKQAGFRRLLIETD